jgi:hypothetical protein
MVFDESRQILYFTDIRKGTIESYTPATKRNSIIYSGLDNPSSISVMDGGITWSEGYGRSMRLMSGTTSGADATTLARAGAFDGTETNLIWRQIAPSKLYGEMSPMGALNMMLYFLREDALMSYSPEANEVKTVRDTGVWMIGRAPRDGLFIVTWNYEIYYWSPSTGKEVLLKTTTDRLDSISSAMFNMRTLTSQIQRLEQASEDVDSDVQYIYYISEGSVVKARKDNPDSRTVITREGASHVNVDAARQVMYYVLYNTQLVSDSMEQWARHYVMIDNIGAVGDDNND